MKIVIIGGVAAGTKTAAKLKRERPQDEVVLYTKGSAISYAGCGLPYYVGGVIQSKEALVVNTPQKFTALTGVTVHTNCEINGLDAQGHTVSTKDGESISYDRLVLAVGAEPILPPLSGAELPGVFSVRTPEDAIQIRQYLTERECRNAVVVGGGFIGLEMAENLMLQGLNVTLMDMAPQLLTNLYDPDMADYLRRQLEKKGLKVLLKTAIKGIGGKQAVESVECDTGSLPADILILAMGIRPMTAFLERTGLAMDRRTIITDDQHRTNLPDVYAVGDCALVHNRITGKPQWSAMGSTANIAGRELALELAGEEIHYPGCLGTGVAKISDSLSAARTGLTVEQARAEGWDAESVVAILNDKAHYYAGASDFVVKLVADRATHRLLGLQVMGPGAVDKMADVAVTAISLKARLEDLVPMDFAYAPPFSTAIHPMAAACGVLLNKLSGRMDSITPAEYAAGAAEGYHLVDAQPAPSIQGLDWFDLTHPEESAKQFDPNEKLLLVCAKGKRAYLSQNKLRALGFTQIKVLEGGVGFNVLK